MSETEFSSALNLLRAYERHGAFTRPDIQEILDSAQISIKDLRNHLIHFDKKGLTLFRKIISKITYGCDLPLLMNGSPVEFYENVVHDLSKMGWDGVFVIFDEFSKAMDGTAGEITARLKTIQDFAELANRSTPHQQILFTCITHKSMNLYASGKSEDVMTSFRTVEGRFIELKLNKNSQESLQLLALSLERKEGYDDAAGHFLRSEKENLLRQAEMGIADYEQLTYAAKNTYPFVPLSVFLLIQLSEVAAQNERTMFTVLSDSTPSSFASFLGSHSEGLYTADLLYDYFEEQIEKMSESSANLIRKCKASLSLELNELSKKIMKAVVLLSVVEPYSSFRPDLPLIADVLHEDKESVRAEVRSLEKAGLLRTDLFSGLISYPYSASNEIKSAIAQINAKGISQKEIKDELYELSGERYFIPQQYNLKYRILRYFDSIQLEFESFMHFYPAADKCLNADGLFINLYVNELSEAQKQKVYSHFAEITRDYPLQCLRIIELNWKLFRQKLVDLNAAKKALKQIELSDLAKDELQQIVYDQTVQLRNLLRQASNQAPILYLKNDVWKEETGSRKNVERALSILCENVYTRTPVINNELIVRHQLSAAYTKAVRFVTDGIIAGELEQDVEKVSPTSPERTVYRSFFEDHALRKELLPVIEEIQKNLLQVFEDKKVIQFSSLFSILRTYPYGIREGLIPPLIAWSLVSLDKNPVLYYQSQQIELSYNNLLKSLENPGNYTLKLTTNAAKEKEYLDELLRFYNLPVSGSFYKKMDAVLNSIRQVRNRLPMVIREASARNNMLDLDRTYLDLNLKLSRFDINSYEFLFDFLWKRFDENPSKVVEFLDNLPKLSQKLDLYIKELAGKVSEVFGGRSSDSIRSAYDSWIRQNNLNINSIVLEGNNSRLNAVMKKAHYDNTEVLRQISKTLTGYSIEDWSIDNSKIIIKEVGNYVASVESARNNMGSSSKAHDSVPNQTEDIERTIFGQLLMNSLESSLEEFGSSVSNLEKMEILEILMGQIQNGGFS